MGTHLNTCTHTATLIALDISVFRNHTEQNETFIMLNNAKNVISM